MTLIELRRATARRRTSRSAAALLGVGLFLASLPARSEVIDIAWKDGDRFDRTLTVAPGKFAELCGTLDAGKTVTWSFDADGELDFNIHYHAGKDVRYPSRMARVRRSDGNLTVDMAQDYCWMWANESATVAKLAVRLVLK